MGALSRFLSRAALWVSAAGLVVMTLMICWQVFARYVLNAAPAWTEQAALLLMLYFILFAAAAGVREGFHIRLSLLQESLPPVPQRALRVFAHLVVGGFGVAMAYAGGQLIAETWQHVIPTLGIPRGIAYVPLAGAGGLIAFFSLEHLIAEWRGGKVVPLWN